MIYTGGLGHFARKNRPSPGTKLDLRHPVLKNIVGFWSCTERLGFPYDVFSQAQVVIEPNSTVLTTPIWGVTSYGPALISTLNNGPIYRLQHQTIDFSSNITIVIWITFNAFQTAGPNISALLYNDQQTYFMRLGDSGVVMRSLQIVKKDSDLKANSSNLLSTDTPYAIAMTLSLPDGGGNIIQGGWVNGELWCSQSTTTNVSSQFTSINYTSIFRDDTDPGLALRAPDAKLWAVGLWKRLLSPRELAMIANPIAIGQLFEPQIDYTTLYQRLATQQVNAAIARVLIGNSLNAVGQPRISTISPIIRV